MFDWLDLHVNRRLQQYRYLPQKWQDLVFFVGEVVFLVGLVPSIINDNPPDPWTSFPTAFMLFTFMLVHASFKLWFTFSLTWITAMLWVVLGIQGLT